MITYHGKIEVPQALIDHADKIKLENYKVNKPGRDQIRHNMQQYCLFTADLAYRLNLRPDQLDFVYFSCCKGAEPHVDQLPPKNFEDTTYVVPVILPKGLSVIHAEETSIQVEVGGVYEFDHTKTHSMTLEDTESGCVVIMVAIKK